MLYSLSGFLLQLPLIAGHLAGSEDLPRLNKKPQVRNLTFNLTGLTSPSVISETVLPVPPSCSAYTSAPNAECTTNMQAINVLFSDCGDPYTICRCNNAELTLGEAIDYLGRVPIGLRRFMGTVMVMPSGGNGTHAYTWPSSGETHFFGQCDQRTWIHEATHSADGTLNISQLGTGPWAYAIAQDSCVPDRYSDKNAQEDLAQASVVKTYMLLNQGHLPPGFEQACMQNQLQYLSSLPLYYPTSFFGRTCSLVPLSRHNLAPPRIYGTSAPPQTPVGRPT